MKQFKSILAMLLVLLMVISCVGTAFAADAVRTADVAEIAQNGEDAQALKGFRNADFAQQNTYRYAEDETVRAIVLLEGAPEAESTKRGSAGALAQRELLKREHQSVFAAMAGIDFTLAYEFTSLINGFSCDVAYGDLDKIADIDDVDAVYIANSYAEPTLKTQSAHKTLISALMAGNYDAVNAGYNGSGTVIAVLDTGLRVTHEAFADADGSCAESGRLTEKDASKAAVAGVYVNAKIPFAYDYADMDADVADRNGHGTHVAGIAAGCAYNEQEGGYTFLGAAPCAQILAMKIFKDAGGGTTSDIYFYALEDAYRLGADVVNMSIGSQNGFTYDSSLETEVFGNIYKRMENAGIILSVAAGNEYSMAEYAHNDYIGPEYTDYGTVASPSTYEGNLSVASVENYAYPAYYLTVDGQIIGYTDSSISEEDTVGLWRAAFGGKETAFVVVPDGNGGISLGAAEDYKGVDVKGKIAVVQRGDITFQEKSDNAAAAGAIGCIVVNNQAGLISMMIDPFQIPTVSVTVDTAELFLNAASTKVMTSDEMDYVKNPYGYQMSTFSNWGTSPMLTIDPTFTSIGGNVYSTYFTEDDSYELMSGTSMAAPNATGTIANVLSFLMVKCPELSKTERADYVKALLEGTAEILYDQYGMPYSVRRQGTGLANAASAIDTYNRAAFVLDPIKELGDDAKKTGVYSFDVTLTNKSDKAARYADFGTVILTDYIDDVSGADAEDAVMGNYLAADGIYLNGQGDAEITYSVGGREITSFDILPGQTVTVNVKITLGEDIKGYLDETFPNGAYIEGYVTFSNEEIIDKHSFIDCPDAWYQDAVDYVAFKHLMGGVGKNLFDPQGTMSRAMMVTVLYRAVGSPAVSGPSTFVDVPTNEWYTDAVAWAQENNIVGGVGKNRFAPDDCVTREQIATILWRFEDCPEVEADLSSFKDADTISDWAKDAMTWAVAAGIFNGDNGRLKPTESATRAEFACIIMRYLYEALEESYDTHATFLAYYGDWTKASVLEKSDFRDYLAADYYLNQVAVDNEGNTLADLGYTVWDLLDFYTMPNMAYTADLTNNSLVYFLGANIVDAVPFDDAYISFSTDASNGTNYYANAIYLTPYQLRNARNLIMTVTNAKTGEVYYVDDTEYLPKAYFDEENGTWENTGLFAWDGTDADNYYVPSGTVAHVQFDAVLPYGEDPSGKYEGAVQKDVWSFDVTVDYTAPVLKSVVFDKEAKTLTVTASDEQYLQALYISNSSGSKVYDAVALAPEKAGEDCTATFDVSALMNGGLTEVFVNALDYATNLNSQMVKLIDSGKPATLTFVTPSGTETVNTTTGSSFTFPETDESYDGFEFWCWTTVEVEKSDGSDLNENQIFWAGDTVTVGGDATYYALYAYGETDVLDEPEYYVPENYGTNFDGDWALVGWNVNDNGYYVATDPVAMDENGAAKNVKTQLSGTVSTQYLDFTTANDTIRFTAEKQADGTYTLKNAASGKYLALGTNNAIAMVDTVTANACWTMEMNNKNSTANVSIVNAADRNKILLYDDDAQKFAIFDDTQLISTAYGDFAPSEYYTLRLYVGITEDFTADYFTTKPNA